MRHRCRCVHQTRRRLPFRPQSAVTEAALALVVKKRADLEPGSVNNLLKYIIALLRCAKEKHGDERRGRLPRDAL